MEVNVLNILRLFDECSYIRVPKGLWNKIGGSYANLLMELVAKYIYFGNIGHLKDGMFFYKISDLEKVSGIGRTGQNAAIKFFVDNGLLSTKLVGMPAKRYFWFSDKNVNKILEYSFNADNTKPYSVENTYEDVLEEQPF